MEAAVAIGENRPRMGDKSREVLAGPEAICHARDNVPVDSQTAPVVLQCHLLLPLGTCFLRTRRERMSVLSLPDVEAHRRR